MEMKIKIMVAMLTMAIYREIKKMHCNNHIADVQNGGCSMKKMIRKIDKELMIIFRVMMMKTKAKPSQSRVGGEQGEHRL